MPARVKSPRCTVWHLCARPRVVFFCNSKSLFLINTMTSNIYTSSIPVFKQMLGGLKTVLSKAEAHATEKKIEVL